MKRVDHPVPENAGANSPVKEEGMALPPAMVGQIDSQVFPGQPFALRLPPGLVPSSQPIGGRYFLVRCSSAVGIEREGDWSVFLRRALFICGRQTVEQAERWQLFLPSIPEEPGIRPQSRDRYGAPSADSGVAWLAERGPGDLLNLTGPCGNGFTLPAGPHNLLLVVDIRNGPDWFWKLLALAELGLDKGGRVTILILAEASSAAAKLVPWLPLQAEVRVAVTPRQWTDSLRRTLQWADQVCAGVPSESYHELRHLIRETRIRVDRSFAQILVESDLLCGFGACLVCAVPTARGGNTRACIHGPVFDLTEIAG